MILGIVEEEKAWKKQRVIKLNVDDGNCSLSTPEINKKMTISGWNHTTNEYSLMKWHKNNGREWESCVVAVADEVEIIEKLSLFYIIIDMTMCGGGSPKDLNGARAVWRNLNGTYGAI